MAMTRKKVRLAYITKDAERKASFKKRKRGLVKKVSELSTLCGVDACLVVFGPHDPEPEVWPSALGLQRAVSRFRKMPEYEQAKKMVNQESYTLEMLKKAEEKLRRQQREKWYKEVRRVIFHCLGEEDEQKQRIFLNGLSTAALNDTEFMLDDYLLEINSKIESLKNKSSRSVITSQGKSSSSHLDEGNHNNSMISDCETSLNSHWRLDLLSPNYNNTLLGGGWEETVIPPFSYTIDSPAGPCFLNL